MSIEVMLATEFTPLASMDNAVAAAALKHEGDMQTVAIGHWIVRESELSGVTVTAVDVANKLVYIEHNKGLFALWVSQRWLQCHPEIAVTDQAVAVLAPDRAIRLRDHEDD